ncbi:MAG: hypothetical protein ABIP41_07275 [Croceibacterium sp.]
MGNVHRVDLTLPLNQMVFYVRRDAGLRKRWQEDLPALAAEYGVGAEELAALQPPDPVKLMNVGVHQYLIPHILRLTYGATNMTNTHPALVAYQQAFPRESAAVLGKTKWHKTDMTNG